MSPIIKFNQTDGSAIFRYITLGGKVEAYFMMQGTAKEIIARYQNIIGKPKLPPFWAMGFHAASYAYDTLSKIQTNVEQYDTSKIPLDGVWFDIPYMKAYEDFTVDSDGNFKGTDAYVQELRTTKGKRVVPIIDAGLQNNEQSDYIPDANTYNCLIKVNTTETPIEQKVWPELAG